MNSVWTCNLETVHAWCWCELSANPNANRRLQKKICKKHQFLVCFLFHFLFYRGDNIKLWLNNILACRFTQTLLMLTLTHLPVLQVRWLNIMLASKLLCQVHMLHVKKTEKHNILDSCKWAWNVFLWQREFQESDRKASGGRTLRCVVWVIDGLKVYLGSTVWLKHKRSCRWKSEDAKVFFRCDQVKKQVHQMLRLRDKVKVKTQMVWTCRRETLLDKSCKRWSCQRKDKEEDHREGMQGGHAGGWCGRGGCWDIERWRQMICWSEP